MSSKITIHSDEIIDTLKEIPTLGAITGKDAMDLAMQAMRARESVAVHNRVVIYRFERAANPQNDATQTKLNTPTHDMHAIAQTLNCDFQVIELGTGAFTAEDSTRAAAFGMMATEQDTGLLIVAAFGDGNTDMKPDDFLNNASPETAALFGAMIAGARAGIPVIAEGAQALCAAKAIQQLRPDLCARIFLCGIEDDVIGIPVFASAPDASALPAETALTLAAMVTKHFETCP